MSSRAREIAMQAFYNSDEERARRAEAAVRAWNRQEHERRIERKSKAMTDTARCQITNVLGVDTSGWEVVEAHPTYAVLRDPEDTASDKLTLTVILGEPGERAVVRYTPYGAYGRSDKVGETQTAWHSGPIVTDALSLGKAIKKHEDDLIEMHGSMPLHLP